MRKGKRENLKRAKDEEVNGKGRKGERGCPGPTRGNQFRRFNTITAYDGQTYWGTDRRTELLYQYCTLRITVLCRRAIKNRRFEYRQWKINKPRIKRVQTFANISLYYHSNETSAPIANSPNSAQLQGTSTIPPGYIRVRAVVWARGDGQADTHIHTHARDQYTFRIVYDSRVMYKRT